MPNPFSIQSRVYRAGDFSVVIGLGQINDITIDEKALRTGLAAPSTFGLTVERREPGDEDREYAPPIVGFCLYRYWQTRIDTIFVMPDPFYREEVIRSVAIFLTEKLGPNRTRVIIHADERDEEAITSLVALGFRARLIRNTNKDEDDYYRFILYRPSLHIGTQTQVIQATGPAPDLPVGQCADCGNAISRHDPYKIDTQQSILVCAMLEQTPLEVTMADDRNYIPPPLAPPNKIDFNSIPALANELHRGQAAIQEVEAAHRLLRGILESAPNNCIKISFDAIMLSEKDLLIAERSDIDRTMTLRLERRS